MARVKESRSKRFAQLRGLARSVASPRIRVLIFASPSQVPPAIFVRLTCVAAAKGSRSRWLRPHPGCVLLLVGVKCLLAVFISFLAISRRWTVLRQFFGASWQHPYALECGDLRLLVAATVPCLASTLYRSHWEPAQLISGAVNLVGLFLLDTAARCEGRRTAQSRSQWPEQCPRGGDRSEYHHAIYRRLSPTPPPTFFPVALNHHFLHPGP